MGREFDRDRVAELGWGQGAILDRRVLSIVMRPSSRT